MRFETHGNACFQKLVTIGLTLFACVLFLRIAQFSIVQSADWKDRALRRITRTMDIEPKRGRIIAGDGRTILAESRVALSIASDNCAVRSTGKECLIAGRLAEIINEPVESVISRIHSRHNAEWQARDIDRAVFKHFLKVQLDGFLPGIHVKREIQRVYPEHPHAASLVGFVTQQREPGFDTLGPFQHLSGIEGLERAYNSELSGQYGQVSYRINRFYSPEHDSFQTVSEVQDGLDLVTSIDVDLQRIVREELLKGLELNQADTAMAIIMDPWTGEILASESVENTEEHKNFEYRAATPMNCWPADARRNQSLISTFEPGSVWKPVMMAIALENGLAHPGEIIPWKRAVVLGGHAFRDWKDFNRDLLLKEVLIWSSNVGIIEVSKRIFGNLPNPEVFEQIQGMGFLRNLPTDYPVQPSGTLDPARWGPITIGAVAEGYETSVTISQLAAFYCAIANGGTIVYPHFGKKLLDPETGDVVRNLEPETGYPIMSASTAEFIRNALTECIAYGTGSKAHLRDYRIAAAGKTATAKLTVNGSYATNKYRASFCGFFPAKNPMYVVIVSVENPTAGAYYGGQVAAPLFKQIAGRICSDIHGILPFPFPKEI
ncbi:penicillin-binding protein 2 [bacterium]|nr:penicillin-binding protein 2 [candidate division CSSED10-310 bacterium]